MYHFKTGLVEYARSVNKNREKPKWSRFLWRKKRQVLRMKRLLHYVQLCTYFSRNDGIKTEKCQKLPKTDQICASIVHIQQEGWHINRNLSKNERWKEESPLKNRYIRGSDLWGERYKLWSTRPVDTIGTIQTCICKADVTTLT